MPPFHPTHQSRITRGSRVERIDVEHVNGALYTRQEAATFDAADYTLEHDENGDPWLAFQGEPAERRVLTGSQNIGLWTVSDPSERVC